MKQLSRLIVLTFVLQLAVGSIAQADDFPGSQDYPDLPRVEGSRIIGYLQSAYDAGRFVAGIENKKRLLAAPEGKRTRILYLAQEGQSSLQLFRNYRSVFNYFGEYNEVFACERSECKSHTIGNKVVWAADNQIPIDSAGKVRYVSPYLYEDPMYTYGTIARGDSLFHISVFTTFITAANFGQTQHRAVAHVEILEVEKFEPTLAFVGAEEIATELSSKGHVAVYGILFDFDSASIKTESLVSVAEIAKALDADPGMSVFVVGHTDNEGGYDYNLALSEERAKAVADFLVAEHGIDAARLSAAGVGPLAPESTNETNAGRALNRRVEIVRR